MADRGTNMPGTECRFRSMAEFCKFILFVRRFTLWKFSSGELLGRFFSHPGFGPPDACPPSSTSAASLHLHRGRTQVAKGCQNTGGWEGDLDRTGKVLPDADVELDGHRWQPVERDQHRPPARAMTSQVKHASPAAGSVTTHARSEKDNSGADRLPTGQWQLAPLAS